MANTIEEDSPKTPELIRLLQSVAKSESNTNSISNHCGNCEWTTDETTCLLKFISECDFFTQLKFENDEIYNKLSKLMTSSGHTKSYSNIKSYCSKLKQKLAHYKINQFSTSGEVTNSLELDLSCHAEPEMIIIKGEEIDGSLDLPNTFYNEKFYEKNSKGIRRNIWTHKETECVIEVLEKYGMPTRTNLRKFCLVVVDYLKENGFIRSEEQAQIKMKHLRALYNQVLRKTLREEEFPFFSRIKSVMQAQEVLMRFKDYDHMQSFISVEEQSKSDGEDCTNTEFSEDDTTSKKARQIWTNKEIRVLLKFIEDNNIISGKQLRKMSSKAVEYLASYGFYRSSTQILIRWKNTKAVYWATFRKKLSNPERECSFFYQLHNILNPDDSSYETKIVSEDDDLTNQNDNIFGSECRVDVANLNFNQSSTNQSDVLRKENTVNPQNSSNSSDTFLNINSSFVPKPLQNTDLSDDPLENEDEKVVIPSSPKRSRMEKIQSGNRDCAFCGVLDSVDHYCISLAHSIKRLDARKQAKLKIEIQQLMYKAEFDPDF